MAHLSTNSLGDILDNYADVIEGGSAYSGNSYNGIPGTQSNDPGLRTGSDGSITASGNGTTTTIVYASGTWDASRWDKDTTPQFYAVCTGATNGANVGAARRITNWTLGSTTFAVDAFPAATTSADAFIVRQGFKRLPNGIDIEDKAETGWDRFFRLDVTGAGDDLGYYGADTATHRTTMTLRLRMLKFGRDVDARAAVFENLAILRRGLVKGAHRETTYTRALTTAGRESIVKDDDHKIVVSQQFELIYRMNLTFL